MTALSTASVELQSVVDAHGRPIAWFRHYPTENILYVHWVGNLTGEEVIRVAKVGGGIQERLRCPLLLNDKTESTGDWSEALPWLEYEWLPAAIEQGLRAFAYVFSPDLQNQYITTEFVERVGAQLPAQLFYNHKPAWEWLRRQHEAA